MRVMLGDQEWFVLSGMYLPYFNAMFDFNTNLSGLDEIKQFSMKEESTFHLPSKTFNEMYSFDKPLGMHSQEIFDRRSNCNGDFINFSFLQGIIFPDGNLWKEQRKFAMKTLKQLGLGKNSLEHHIEVKV